ncbi:hypothetical protein LINPERPRIM_LOCUS10051 [Linum perenne]
MSLIIQILFWQIGLDLTCSVLVRVV